MFIISNENGRIHAQILEFDSFANFGNWISKLSKTCLIVVFGQQTCIGFGLGWI